jgi:hypothetical protein
MATETLTAKEAARELGTDARTFRKFMRAVTPKEDQPGQGNRYSIEQRKMKALKKQFDEWSAPKAKASDNGEVTEVIEDFEDDFLGDDEEEELVTDDEFLADDVSDEPSDEDILDIEGEEDIFTDDLEEL